MAPLSGIEVAKHNTKDSVWVIIHGEAFDVTEFLPEHPGGPAIIMKYAGKDASAAYDPIHPPGTIQQYLPKDKHLGAVNMASVEIEEKAPDPAEEQRLERLRNLPALATVLNLYDFEALARHTLADGAWAYYSSGADDEITLRENRTAWQRIWFRPRILRDVKNIDYSHQMLGSKCSLPVYITATALGKLGHKDGEVNLTKGAAKQGVIQMIPTLASCSFDEIVDAADPGQVQWMQLYVNADRKITEKSVRHAEKRGVKGLFITVDAPQLGRREKDMRLKFADQGSDVQRGDNSVDNSQGAARAISSFIDPSLKWDDLKWLKSITKMPIVLKGVQCWEDAVMAAEHGVQGIVLSNHGGRQLDNARSGIEILPEVVQALESRGLRQKLEIFVDGGIRRGADILKAIALGANGVGLGRPFLYAYSTYGVDGVVRAIQILKDELEMDMRLLGAPTIKDVTREMVDDRMLTSKSMEGHRDWLASRSYAPLTGVGLEAGVKPKL